MTYEYKNGVRIVGCPVSDFRIVAVDKVKKSAYSKNYANAGFFGYYDAKDPKEHFTLPAGNLKCDYEIAASKTWSKYYANERGKFVGDKWIFDSYNWSYMNGFYHHTTTNLIIANGMASIKDINSAYDVNSDYMITGVPIMRGGNDVKFSTYVKGQGWDGSTLYATYHIFVGLKKATDNVVYIMEWKSTTGNMITSAEAYKKFKALGFYDVIKLDGGGSMIININGSVTATSENRQIHNIIVFDPKTSTNSGTSNTTTAVKPSTNTGTTTTKKYAPSDPYPVPTRVLKQGCSGNDVKWLQWLLYQLGFGTAGQTLTKFVDGSFGPGTKTCVQKWQKAYGLTVDGSFGPASRAKAITL